ncbi:MAG: ferritin [Cytophagales bacterium]|nr:ferritin [Cytophagales bacterium]
MGNTRRNSTPLSLEMVKVLNQQVALEALSSAKYLAAAAWCGSMGYDNSSEFFFKQAEEERMHMLKIFRYICDLGGKAISPSVADVNVEFNSLRDVFEFTLDSEIMVSESINGIVKQARIENDYPTENFIQWFVEEQIEEEFVARRAVELFDLMGEDKLAIFMIDERIPKIAFSGHNGGEETGA